MRPEIIKEASAEDMGRLCGVTIGAYIGFGIGTLAGARSNGSSWTVLGISLLSLALAAVGGEVGAQLAKPYEEFDDAIDKKSVQLELPTDLLKVSAKEIEPQLLPSRFFDFSKHDGGDTSGGWESTSTVQVTAIGDGVKIYGRQTCRAAN